MRLEMTSWFLWCGWSWSHIWKNVWVCGGVPEGPINVTKVVVFFYCLAKSRKNEA